MSEQTMVMWALIVLVAVIPFSVDVFYTFDTTKKIASYYLVDAMEDFLPHGLHILMELSILLAMVTLCRIFQVPDYIALGAGALVVWRKRK